MFGPVEPWSLREQHKAARDGTIDLVAEVESILWVDQLHAGEVLVLPKSAQRGFPWNVALRKPSVLLQRRSSIRTKQQLADNLRAMFGSPGQATQTLVVSGVRGAGRRSTICATLMLTQKPLNQVLVVCSASRARQWKSGGTGALEVMTFEELCDSANDAYYARWSFKPLKRVRKVTKHPKSIFFRGWDLVLVDAYHQSHARWDVLDSLNELWPKASRRVVLVPQQPSEDILDLVYGREAAQILLVENKRPIRPETILLVPTDLERKILGFQRTVLCTALQSCDLALRVSQPKE